MTDDVIWTEDAENQLADIWTRAADRNAVARASNRIDALLGTNPTTVGESRSPGRRVLIEPPLVAFYEVMEDDKRVRALRVLAC